MTRQQQTLDLSVIQAAEWRVRLTECEMKSTPEFEIWLLADPAHRIAWDRVQAPWNIIGEHQTSPELLELRRAALSNARGTARARWTASIRPRARAFRIAAASMIGIAGLLAWHLYMPDVYRTQAGERRVVTLADGSQVQLDSSTTLRVRFSTHARDLTLSKGQARFDVAHDVERPFSVTAGEQRVIATGTAFNVDLLGSSLLVTLIEGHVVILPEHAAPEGSSHASKPRVPQQHIELDAGQELVVSPTGASSIFRANIERATAWQTGQLVFDDEPLSSVIERVNRYSDRPLVLADEQTAQFRISGVFHTGDTSRFVDTLTRYLPIKVDRRDDSILLSRR
jgi:transmembrane sensor